MIGGALPLVIVMVSTTLSSVKAVQTTVLLSGNGYPHPVTRQRRRRVSNIFSRDLKAGRNNLANLSGTLISHILSWTGRQAAVGPICYSPDKYHLSSRESTPRTPS
jgi:hypothetical protein